MIEDELCVLHSFLIQSIGILNCFVYQKPLIQTFHTSFDYIKTFMNLQHKNTNSKVDFFSQKPLKC